MNRYRGNLLADVEANAAKLGVKVAYAVDFWKPPPCTVSWPDSADGRVQAIVNTMADGNLALLKAAMSRPGRRPTREPKAVMTRRLVWRLMASSGVTVTPSFPEVARAWGLVSHSTVIESVRLPVIRDQLPRWAIPLWRLAEEIGLAFGGEIPGLVADPVASQRTKDAARRWGTSAAARSGVARER